MSLAGTVMVPKPAAVLPRCMAIAILCSRWWCDRGSPVFTQRWCPTSWRKVRASCPNAPVVSIATGTKRWLDCRLAYFTLFLSSASINCTSLTCGQHHVGWGKGVGACHIPSKDYIVQPHPEGGTVEPYSLFPSDRQMPDGFSWAGTPAVTSDH